jgi:hypothetical protein
MNRALDQKSTIGQIRERFDNDVERFSKLETGQQATIDAPLVLEIVAQTAATHLQPHSGGALGWAKATIRLMQGMGWVSPETKQEFGIESGRGAGRNSPEFSDAPYRLDWNPWLWRHPHANRFGWLFWFWC